MYKILKPQTRTSRQGSRGQVIVIFALMAVILFAIVGLSIDSGISYLAADRSEHAAAAGALAGVPYMPDDYTNAVLQAQLASEHNGFDDGDTTGGRNVTVTVSPVFDANNVEIRNELKVTVAENVPTTFLNIIGFGTHRVSRYAIASYLRPITLGQPGNQLGGTVAPVGTGPAATLGNGQAYIMRTEGYGTPRSQGDAFTPNNAGSTDVHLLSGSTGLDNADNTLPTLGGYNYQVFVPAGQQGVVKVYNTAFAPDNGYPNPGSNYNMHEQDNSFSNYGDKTQYSTMEYTIFKVNNVFDHNSDTKLSQMLVNPIDARNAPTSYVNVNTGQTITQTFKADGSQKNMLTYHNWVDVGTYTGASDGNTVHRLQTLTATLSGGSTTGTYYRLRVDTLDYAGNNPSGSTNSQAHKGYAVEVVGPPNAQGVNTTCVGCTIGGLDDLCIYTPVTAGGFVMPVFSLPPEYAGQTVSIDIYDPGDLASGTFNHLQIIDPTTGQPLTNTNGVSIYDLGASRSTTPSAANKLGSNTQPNPNVASVDTIVNGANVFNGHWLHFELPIPSTYNPGNNPSAWFWQLRYDTDGTATDTITVALGYGGSPVHLKSES